MKRESSRISVTLFVVALYAAASWYWNLIEPGMVAGAGVKQLSNDPTTYAAAQRLAQGAQWVDNVLLVSLLAALFFIWRSVIRRALSSTSSSDNSSRVPVVFGMLMVSALLSGCLGPPQLEMIEEIANNETGFVIPLEGDGLSQAKFDSIEFLEAKKVPGKRVSLAQRKQKTRRGWGGYKYIPTEKLIKVSRAPVAREWTLAGETGTSPQNQAIEVESLESIGFAVGMAITASIEEPNTAKFLYYFPSGSLELVMDTVIRNSATQFLSTEFGNRELALGIKDKGAIFAQLKSNLIEEYEKVGITISTVGLSEGLTYTNSQVQQVIDDVFQAGAQATRQSTSNMKDIDTANAQATVSVMQAGAQAAAVATVNAALNNTNSDNYVALEWIKAWQAGGEVPQFMGGANGGVFLNIPIGPTPVR